MQKYTHNKNLFIAGFFLLRYTQAKNEYNFEFLSQALSTLLLAHVCDEYLTL